MLDNGSRSGDVEYLTTYETEVQCMIWMKHNMLFTKGVNTLLAAALGEEFSIGEGNRRLKLIEYIDKYDQFIVVNPDIEFKEGWDKDLEQNTGIMGFTLVKPNGIIEHAGGIGQGDHLGRGEEDSGNYQELRDVDWVTFGCVAIHKSVIEKIGKLDENFPHFGSDREFCKLAKKNGISVKCSGARLIHGFGKSTRPYIFSGIPDDIWKKHVAERRSSGVFFPEDQSRMQRLDAPGKYLPFR